jgi:2-polyprenyl-3-methyl-5-hydroxy-6-metoxy-1,4-benzoquinol methylase
MMENLGKIYTEHHKFHREPGFSILKDERGGLLKGMIGRGKSVLDLGCRDGALTKYFAEGNRVLGADIDNEGLEEARKIGIRTVRMDLNGDWREIGDEKFDAVVAGEVLEHLYYPEKVAEKVAVRLNAGGFFLGSVPNAFSIKNRLRYLFGIKKNTPLSDHTHINQFHAEELEGILKRHFSSVEVMGLGKYKTLAKLSPNLFAFDLFFIAKK